MDCPPPQLIEHSLKSYMDNVLSNCHVTRVHVYHIVLNVSVFIVFILIIGITLYYCYKKKPSEIEYRQKMIRDQEYVLNKIRFYQEQKNKQVSPITNLPIIE
jgi:hypothetical protein